MQSFGCGLKTRGFGIGAAVRNINLYFLSVSNLDSESFGRLLAMSSCDSVLVLSRSVPKRVLVHVADTKLIKLSFIATPH